MGVSVKKAEAEPAATDDVGRNEWDGGKEGLKGGDRHRDRDMEEEDEDEPAELLLPTVYLTVDLTRAWLSEGEPDE